MTFIPSFMEYCCTLLFLEATLSIAVRVSGFARRVGRIDRTRRLRHRFLSLGQAAPYLSGLICVGSGLVILVVMLREMIALRCGGSF